MPDQTTSEPGEPGGDVELDELRALARRLEPGPVTWESPPPDLWHRIADAAGVAAEPDAEPPTGPAHAGDNVRPLSPPGGGQRGRGTGDARRRGVRPWTLAAAAAVVVVIAAGALVLGARSTDDTTVVAISQLERLGEAGEGRAELVDHDGSLQLRLSTSGLDPGAGFLEVWVINTDVTQLVSLGPLRSDGIYDLPPGLDPASFPIVDVSVEPIDGNPTHSGDSVLRGELTF